MVSLLVAALVNTYCNCIRGEGYLLERRLGTIPILRQHTFGRFLTHPATHYTEVRFCQFLFRWIYYCHSSKSTGMETDKMHLCALCHHKNNTECQQKGHFPDPTNPVLFF